MKTTISTRPFDAAEYLNTEESIAAFVTDAMESGDPAIFQSALNTAARARGMAQIADASGLGRESLYKALRPDAKPQFGTIVKVLGALGVKLVVQPAEGRRIEAKALVRKAVRKSPKTHAEVFHTKVAPAKRSTKRQASGS